MDEKGFMMGQIQKSHRVFTKDTYEANKLVAAGQDGNREWITVLATICADGNALSPALIYKAASGDLQDTWLEDFDLQEHSCYFGASTNGWTSNDHGFEWLQSVFENETKSKARRSRRLLFLDGHGSHLNMRFLNWCLQHKILIACYPPHSTHRLQPLDVSCFAPLASYYSQGLDDLIRKSEGHTRIKKRDFFSIFWSAFTQAFRKDFIKSAWSKTGIWPWNPEEVLRSFPKQQPSADQLHASKKRRSSSPPSGYNTPSKIKKVRRCVNAVTAATTPRTSRTVKHLGRALLRTSAEFTLARLDNMQLRESLAREKRYKKRQKKLFEQIRADSHCGTLFLSPSQVQKARDLAISREQQKEQLHQDKADRTRARAAEKALKQAEAQKKRAARVTAVAERREAAVQKKAALEEAREAKKAQKKREKATNLPPRPCRRLPKQPIVKKQKVVKEVKQPVQMALKQQRTARGRIVKPSAKIRA